MTFGVDAHKWCHTIVAVDETGGRVAVSTVGSSTADHLEVLARAQRHIPAGEQRRWAIEDYRHLSRRLEADLFVRVRRWCGYPRS